MVAAGSVTSAAPAWGIPAIWLARASKAVSSRAVWDPEALKKLLAQLLGGAGGAGGSQGSGGSGGGNEEEDPLRKQMSGDQQQGMQMPQENNSQINFG